MRQLFTTSPLMGIRAVSLVFISLLLILLDQHVSRFSTVRACLTWAVAPIHYVVDTPYRWFETAHLNFAKQQTLIQANRQLQSKQLLLEAKIHALIALLHENHDIKHLTAKLPAAYQHFLMGRLLAVDLQPARHQMLIDQGSKKGVYVGQPVIDGHGIIGQIIQVNALQSTVLLLTDVRSAIPVQVTRNGIRGVVLGMGASKALSLINLVDTTGIKVGDLLVTSGLGGRYPAGYPVGKVTQIKRTAGRHFLAISVQPAAHLHQGRQVLLINTHARGA